MGRSTRESSIPRISRLGDSQFLKDSFYCRFSIVWLHGGSFPRQMMMMNKKTIVAQTGFMGVRIA